MFFRTRSLALLVGWRGTGHRSIAARVASWYEMFDQDTDGWGGILDHFGIVRWNCDPGNCVNNTDKPAYDDVRAQVSTFKF